MHIQQAMEQSMYNCTYYRTQCLNSEIKEDLFGSNIYAESWRSVEFSHMKKRRIFFFLTRKWNLWKRELTVPKILEDSSVDLFNKYVWRLKSTQGIATEAEDQGWEKVTKNRKQVKHRQ